MGLFFKLFVMAEKKPKKEAKEYTVNIKSVGSRIAWKGKSVILNNGLPQSTLKAMFIMGIRSITKKLSK